MDEAFELLDRALEERTPSLFSVAHRHEVLGAALRRDSRWKPFVKRLRQLVRLPPGASDPFS